jgi:hypothetical protein
LEIERKILRKRIKASGDRSDVLQAAVRLLELDCKIRGIRKRQTTRTLEEWMDGKELPGDMQTDLRELVEARSARIYGRHGPESLTEEERLRIISLLDRWGARA